VPFNWLFADGHVDNFLKDVPYRPGEIPSGEIPSDKLPVPDQPPDAKD
jgi:hypothetical protein